MPFATSDPAFDVALFPARRHLRAPRDLEPAVPAIHRVVALFAGVVAVVTEFAAPCLAQRDAGPDGRWIFRAPILQITTTAATVTDTEQEVVLDLRSGARGTLTGTVAVGLRMPLTVTHPWHRVEIADGVVDGRTVSFSAWQYDQYRGTLRYAGIVDGDTLRLTITRDTPRGPERREVVARRSAF